MSITNTSGHARGLTPFDKRIESTTVITSLDKILTRGFERFEIAI